MAFITANPSLDEQDRQILAQTRAAREAIAGPRIGDYVRFPTGELERFSKNLVAGVQTSPSGAFFICGNGEASLSCGGLNPPISREALELYEEQVLYGSFWFFHHGRAGAGRRVDVKLPCRIFTTSEPYKGFLGEEFKSKEIAEMQEQLKPWF